MAFARSLPGQYAALNWPVMEISYADECDAEVNAIELLQQYFFALIRAKSLRLLYGQPLFRFRIE
jgi:hypothetical protein